MYLNDKNLDSLRNRKRIYSIRKPKLPPGFFIGRRPKHEESFIGFPPDEDETVVSLEVKTYFNPNAQHSNDFDYSTLAYKIPEFLEKVQEMTGIPGEVSSQLAYNLKSFANKILISCYLFFCLFLDPSLFG